MTNAELTKRFKEIGLSRVDFATITGLKYETILNWSRKTNSVPTWVGSWLENYEKALKYDELFNITSDEYFILIEYSYGTQEHNIYRAKKIDNDIKKMMKNMEIVFSTKDSETLIKFINNISKKWKLDREISIKDELPIKFMTPCDSDNIDNKNILDNLYEVGNIVLMKYSKPS